MIVDTYYRCHACTVSPEGSARMVRETIYCAAPARSVTSREEAERAAWKLWRQLAPYHRVAYVIVTGADVTQGGRWSQQDFTQGHRFEGDELAARSPQGSPYATKA